MTDYDALLDPEIQAFVAKTLAFYPADSYAQTVAWNRATYDEMCAAFVSPRPDGLAVQDRLLGSVPMRVYQPANVQAACVVLYFHGGGFVLGGLDSHDDVCAEIAATCGLETRSVDYRLCPEHSRMDALEDAQTALADALAEGRNVIIAGDSAGGWLGAALVGLNRGQSAILGQVLIYPGLGGTMQKASMTQHAHAPLLSAAEVASYALAEDEAKHSPLAAYDFTGLPPTFALGAECDPLADDVLIYANAITAAGGQALAIVEPGLVHGHLRARHMSQKAARSFARVTTAISQLAQTRALDALVLSAT